MNSQLKRSTRNTVLVALSLAALLGGPAQAQETPAYVKRDCQAVIASATQFHICLKDNLAAANAALGTLYRKLMNQSVFYVGSRARLRDVERSWIAYKDKECEYEYGPITAQSDEDHRLAFTTCEIGQTEARIRELGGRPSCTGGDSLCTPHMR